MILEKSASSRKIDTILLLFPIKPNQTKPTRRSFGCFTAHDRGSLFIPSSIVASMPDVQWTHSSRFICRIISAHTTFRDSDDEMMMMRRAESCNTCALLLRLARLLENTVGVD